MILRTTKNPLFRWYKPQTWLKIPEVVLEENDTMVVNRVLLDKGVLTMMGGNNLVFPVSEKRLIKLQEDISRHFPEIPRYERKVRRG